MTMSIGASFSSPKLFGGWFAGESWDNWRAILRAMFAERMTKAELAFFKSVAGGKEPPKNRVREATLIIGRRGGKDSAISGVAAHVSASFQSAGRLRPGERATVAALAVDKTQAQIVHGYIKAFFEKVPSLRALVQRETLTGFELTNGVDILILSSDFRSLRGRTILLGLLDELAYWPTSEHAARPDREVLRSLRGGMLTLSESMIISISTAYRRDGALYEAWQKHFGKDSPTALCIQAESRQLNPTLDPAEIAAALSEDPEAARADFLSEWRDAISVYLSRDLIEGAVDRGVTARPHDPRHRYFSFIDASSGQRDSFALGICHAEGRMIVLDCLHEVMAPFDTSAAAMTVAATRKGFDLHSTMSDAYAVGWVTSELAKHGIRLEPSPLSRTELYSETLALFSSGCARLLDNKRLVSQYISLERRLLPGSKERIDHPNRNSRHDDLSNVTAGCFWRASQQQGVHISPDFVARLQQQLPRRREFGSSRSPQMLFRPTPQQLVPASANPTVQPDNKGG